MKQRFIPKGVRFDRLPRLQEKVSEARMRVRLFRRRRAYRPSATLYSKRGEDVSRRRPRKTRRIQTAFRNTAAARKNSRKCGSSRR